MPYFLDTIQTIPAGVGFNQYDGVHLSWLAAFLVLTVINCIWYRKMDSKGKDLWKKVISLLIIADEIFKMVMLFIGDRYIWDYLPLHLCSINIILIAVHAFRPTKILGGYLYTVGIPGAMAALLFPSWAALPLDNFMHIHSFTVHILLAMYPLVLALSGELSPQVRHIPKYLGILVALAIPVLIVNLLLDTNFMFLMYAEPGNPLYLFEQAWGSHLLGFPVLIIAVLLVMYVPMEIFRKYKKKA